MLCIMRRIAIIVMVLVCEACSIDRTEPAVVMHSERAANEVAECVQSMWLEHGPGYPAIKARYGDHGYTVQLRSNALGALAIADIVPEGHGSTIALRSAMHPGWPMIEETQPCI